MLVSKCVTRWHSLARGPTLRYRYNPAMHEVSSCNRITESATDLPLSNKFISYNFIRFHAVNKYSKFNFVSFAIHTIFYEIERFLKVRMRELKKLVWRLLTLLTTCAWVRISVFESLWERVGAADLRLSSRKWITHFFNVTKK